MTAPDLNQLWSDFLVAWPPERVRQMTLEEYTNPDKDDAFIFLRRQHSFRTIRTNQNEGKL